MKEIAGIDPTLLANIPGRPADFVAQPVPPQFEPGYLWALAQLIAQQATTEPVDTLPQPPAFERAVHRIILAVDIEGSTKQINAAKARLRAAMYDLTANALRRAGITDQLHDPMVDRGDSVLVLIHPTVPKSLLFETVVPSLAELLADHNTNHPEYGFRLRVVVHAGEVHWDGRGWFGESLDIACRLLDATDVKKRLNQTKAPAVLVVSDHVHASVILQGCAGMTAECFVPVNCRVGGHTHRGWVRDISGSAIAIEAG